MKEQIKQLKAIKKQLAKEIRSLKSTRKKCRNGYVPGLHSKQEKFRINHIAHCLLRGRKPEEIENNVKTNQTYETRYVWKKANEIVDSLNKEIRDETVCTGA